MSDSIVEMYENKIEALNKDLGDARAEIDRLEHQRRAVWTEIARLNTLVEKLYSAVCAAMGVLPKGHKEYEVCSAAFNMLRNKVKS